MSSATQEGVLRQALCSLVAGRGQRPCLVTTLKRQASNLWTLSPRRAKLLKIDPGFSPKSYPRLTKNLSKPQTSLLTQLRTGHIGLNHHLNRIGRADSPRCPECNAPHETVYHYLMECPGHRKHRARLHRKLPGRAFTLQNILSKDTAFRELFAFVQDTGRFSNTFPSLSS